MLKKREGLDSNTELPKPTSIYTPLGHGVITEEQIRDAWDKLADQWADRYTDYGDMNRRYIIDPALFRIMGSVKGLSVLDAGCGNGYLCRLLAKKDAKVVGVDISKRFIAIAKQKEKEAPLGIAYHTASLCDLALFEKEEFDLIVSNLALMDVHDLEKAVKELARILKKDGKLIFSIMHPCFSSPPVHGWVRIPQDSNRREDWIYWKVDRYFERSMETWQYGDMPQTYSFHHPLSDYFRMLIGNGFIITDFVEPVPSEKDIRKHFRELNDCDRISWFLIMAAKKAQMP
jgi:2-polyprenyl-3-methyl-5-hydroxy-6-metoxy-1,4-benzoquinol methylase